MTKIFVGKSQQSKTCEIDAIPLAAHAQCWGCGVLVGPGHSDPGPLQLGLCCACREDLARWRRKEPWLGRTVRPETSAGDELVDTQEAASALRVSSQTIRRMIADGRLKAVQLPRSGKSDARGKRYRCVRSEIEALAEDMVNSDKL